MSLIHHICRCNFRTWLWFFKYIFFYFSQFYLQFLFYFEIFHCYIICNQFRCIYGNKYFLLWMKDIQIHVIICMQLYRLYDCFMLSNFLYFQMYPDNIKLLKNMKRSILSDSNDRFDFVWNRSMNPLKSFKDRILFFRTPFSALKPVNRKYNV